MKKIVNYRPIVLFAMALIFGGYFFVTAFVHEYVYIIIGSLILLGLAIGVFSWIKTKSQKTFVRILALFMLPFVLGGVVSTTALIKKTKVFQTTGTYYVSATIVDGGSLDGKYALTLKDVELSHYENGDFAITLDGEYTVRDELGYNSNMVYAGDRVSFVGDYSYQYTQLVENSPLNAYANNGKFYLRSNLTVVEEGSGIRYSLLKWSKKTLFDNMGKDDATIAYAMLFGDKSLMDHDLKDVYGIAGVSHILAVSGLHVGFLIGIVGWLLSKIIKNKWTQIALLLTLLVAYAYICNWSPSILRAVSMFGVGSLAGGVGKQYDGLNSLAVAGILNFVVAPLNIFDIGFLLSFTVVFSIFAISPGFSQFLQEKLPKKLASGVALSVSAWLGSLPITIFYFKYMSVYSALVNILVIPFVGVLFLVLMVSFVISLIPAFAPLILKVPSLLIKGLNFFVSGVGTLSTSAVNFSIGYAILIFGIITLLVTSDYAFIKRKMLYTAVLVFGFFGSVIIYNF